MATQMGTIKIDLQEGLKVGNWRIDDLISHTRTFDERIWSNLSKDNFGTTMSWMTVFQNPLVRILRAIGGGRKR